MNLGLWNILVKYKTQLFRLILRLHCSPNQYKNKSILYIVLTIK